MNPPSRPESKEAAEAALSQQAQRSAIEPSFSSSSQPTEREAHIMVMRRRQEEPWTLVSKERVRRGLLGQLHLERPSRVPNQAVCWNWQERGEEGYGLLPGVLGNILDFISTTRAVLYAARTCRMWYVASHKVPSNTVRGAQSASLWNKDASPSAWSLIRTRLAETEPCKTSGVRADWLHLPGDLMEQSLFFLDRTEYFSIVQVHSAWYSAVQDHPGREPARDERFDCLPLRTSDIIHFSRSPLRQYYFALEIDSTDWTDQANLLAPLYSNCLHIRQFALRYHANQVWNEAFPRLLERLTVEILLPPPPQRQPALPLAFDLERMNMYKQVNVTLTAYLWRSISRCANLRSLELDVREWNGEGAHVQLPMLKVLRQYWPPMLNELILSVLPDERVFVMLREFPPTLHRLALRGFHWDAEQIQKLTHVQEPPLDPNTFNTRLEVLDLGDTTIHDELARSLSRLRKLTTLKPYRFSLRDPGVIISQLPNLRDLELACVTDTVDVDLLVLALRAVPQLTALLLAHNELTCQQLSTVLPNTLDLEDFCLLHCDNLGSLRCLTTDISPNLFRSLRELAVFDTQLEPAEYLHLLHLRSLTVLHICYSLTPGEEFLPVIEVELSELPLLKRFTLDDPEIARYVDGR